MKSFCIFILFLLVLLAINFVVNACVFDSVTHLSTPSHHSNLEYTSLEVALFFNFQYLLAKW